MARIKQLPPHEAHKIAAGEVVDRPANVVKELIENGIDAGATQISVHIEQAGKALIRVVDNGHGMDQQDAHRCFDHHATSKITTVHDLTTLQTFGFRGEALSSIAAVSSITLITKEAQANEGIKLELEAGTVTQEAAVSCNQGTDISVRSLFFNIPVRKKFLKADETEWRHIVTLFQAFCLDYCSLQFSLFHDGKLVHQCPPTPDLFKRVQQLWDPQAAHHLMSLTTHEDNNYSITGIISNHHTARYDRNHIFFFVNKRWVKNQQLSRALIKGYLNVLPPGHYPTACIFINIDQQQIDVNIHPRKEEVQFLHPKKIESSLQQAIKKSLENHLSTQLKKPVHLAQPPAYTSLQTTAGFTQKTIIAPPFVEFSHATPIHPIYQPPVAPPEQKNQEQKTVPADQNIVHNQSIQSDKNEYHLIGQCHKTYIMIEHEEGLFLVDQHAAHERVLYEQFAQRFERVSVSKLLFPELIKLNEEDMATIKPHLPFLHEHGIEIDMVGDQELIIQATPVYAKDINIKELVHTMIGWVQEQKDGDVSQLKKILQEKLHAQMACKAAVKAGDVLTKQQMEQLLIDLYKTANRFACPHGRPTGWLLTHYEIEKKFKRKL